MVIMMMVMINTVGGLILLISTVGHTLRGEGGSARGGLGMWVGSGGLSCQVSGRKAAADSLL